MTVAPSMDHLSFCGRRGRPWAFPGGNAAAAAVLSALIFWLPSARYAQATDSLYPVLPSEVARWRAAQPPRVPGDPARRPSLPSSPPQAHEARYYDAAAPTAGPVFPPAEPALRSSEPLPIPPLDPALPLPPVLDDPDFTAKIEQQLQERYGRPTPAPEPPRLLFTDGPDPEMPQAFPGPGNQSTPGAQPPPGPAGLGSGGLQAPSSNSAVMPSDRAPNRAPEHLGNLQLRLSANLINHLSLSQDVQTQPYTDEILGTDIQGIATTHTFSEALLIPCADRAIIDLVVRGVAHAKFTGTQRPVVTFGDGQSVFQSRKTLVADGRSLHVYPAKTAVKASSNVHEIKVIRRSLLEGVIEQFAWARYRQQKDLAQAIGGEHAAVRISEGIDTRAQDQMAVVTQLQSHPLYRAVDERQLWPRDARLWTTADALYAVGDLSTNGQKSIVASAPPLTQIPDVGVRLHRSAVENLADAILVGRRFEASKLRQELDDLLGPALAPLLESMAGPGTAAAPRAEAGKPDATADTDDADAITAFTLAADRPVVVTFDHNTVTVTVRFASFERATGELPPFEISVAYRFEVAGGRMLLRRAKEPEALPPGFQVGRDRLGVRQQVVRSLLLSRLEKLVPKEFAVPTYDLPAAGHRPALRFALNEAHAVGGWLALGILGRNPSDAGSAFP